MFYTRNSLAIAWVVMALLVGGSIAISPTGIGLIALVVLALVAPSLILRDAPRVRTVAVHTSPKA